MSGRKTTAIVAVVGCAVLGVTVALVLRHRRQPITLKGAVLRSDGDSDKQAPIANVEITAVDALGVGKATSDSAGFFAITLPKGLRRRQPVILRFRHQDYEPLDLHDFVADKLYIAHMTPERQGTKAAERHPAALVTNPRVRYSVKAVTEPNVGSAAKTFQVTNVGNVPCRKHPPCSPDGKWKAAIGSTVLDAGHGDKFRNIRVSCIAGPCPFTHIEVEELSEEGQRLDVSARDWSDTATFLVEAEVVHPMISDAVREFYPVIFGRALNFSLPASAEGPSIEAEIDGEAIVFPLGPELFLRWADCHSGIDKDQSRIYRCELKPGYRFH
jgi:hypothetical protein